MQRDVARSLYAHTDSITIFIAGMMLFWLSGDEVDHIQNSCGDT